MKSTKEDKTYRHELIGKIIVAESKIKCFDGLVIDESKSTITIKENNKTKKLLKNSITIIKINNKETKIDGKKINVRPHERIRLK